MIMVVFNWQKVGWAAVRPGRPGLSTTLSVKNLPLPWRETRPASSIPPLNSAVYTGIKAVLYLVSSRLPWHRRERAIARTLF